MSRNVRSPESCIREFVNAKFKGSKDYTRQKCDWSLHRVSRVLEEGGFDPSPYRVDEEGVNYVIEHYRRNGKLDTYIKGEIAYLDRYLRFYKNDVVKDMGVRFSTDMRVNVRWLEEDQYQALLAVPKTPLQDVVIHLELRLGFRNVECCRLTLDDICDRGTKPYMNVRGKGRGNGKYRTVRFNVDTKEVLSRWMEERARIVEAARGGIPGWKDPGTLLLWCHYTRRPQAGSYGEHTGSLDDAVIVPLREKVGFYFCNHDLRRTFGRRLYHAGVDIETISKFLGHESTVETLKYIGVNLDDMDAGMRLLEMYDARMGSRKP